MVTATQLLIKPRRMAGDRVRPLLAMVLTAIHLGVAASTSEAPRFSESPCSMPVPLPEVAARLRCGTVRVPRDPTRAQNGHFDLAVVIKRSAAPVAGAAPVLILHGGPGGAQVRYMGQGSKDFVPGRDTIAFDMRGGGQTGPTLCTGTLSALAAARGAALRGEDVRAVRNAALGACWNELKAAGFQPEHFGTERNVADAEAVRQALGIARWSVYGMSYGTAVAAHYLARYPQPIESVVLDSLYPPEGFVPTVREAQGLAVGRVLDECAADLACAKRFPGLRREEAEAALADLDGRPLAFRFEGRAYAADELAVRTALHGLFYSEEQVRAVPWLLDGVRRRDGDALASALALPLILDDASAGSGISMAGLLATDCRDRPRHHTATSDAGPSWMALFTGVQSGACGRWALGTPPALPVGTAVPVLVLSAGFDGFQPDGAAVARAIGPAATAVTVARAAHIVRGAGECPRSLVARFLARPGEPVDTSCLATMSAPAFVLDVAPRPRLVATGLRLQAGQVPWGVLLASAGMLVWLLAGVLAPALAWAGRRGRGGPRTHAAHLALAALGLGALGLAGVALPLAATYVGNPGAMIFGLNAAWASLLWAVPVSGVAGAALAVLAAYRCRWAACAAGLGLVMLAIGAWAVGAQPWA